MLSWIRRVIKPDRLSSDPWWLGYEVEVSQAGFQRIPTRPNQQNFPFIEWAEIYTVDVFKRDLLTTDLVCLSIQAKRAACEVNEEMKGWNLFIAQLAKKIKMSSPNAKWYERVTHHPFEVNHERLFQKRV